MAHTLSTQPTNSVRNLTLAILVVWFLLAVAGSLFGVFDSEPRPPLPLGLAAVIPVTLCAFCYLTSARFQEFVMSLDLRILTVAQTWRVGGIVFLILYCEPTAHRFVQKFFLPTPHRLLASRPEPTFHPPEMSVQPASPGSGPSLPFAVLGRAWVVCLEEEPGYSGSPGGGDDRS